MRHIFLALVAASFGAGLGLGGCFFELQEVVPAGSSSAQSTAPVPTKFDPFARCDAGSLEGVCGEAGATCPAKPGSCVVDIPVDLGGDCLPLGECPAGAPHPIACVLWFEKDTPSCVVWAPGSPQVSVHHTGCNNTRVQGFLRCSSEAGGQIDEASCPTSAPLTSYKSSEIGCP